MHSAFSLQENIAQSANKTTKKHKQIPENELNIMMNSIEDSVANDCNCILNERSWHHIVQCLQQIEYCPVSLTTRFMEIISVGIYSLLSTPAIPQRESIEKYVFVLQNALPAFITLLSDKKQSTESIYQRPADTIVKILTALCSLTNDDEKIANIFKTSTDIERDFLLKTIVKILNAFVEYSPIPFKQLSVQIKRRLNENYFSLITKFSICKSMAFPFFIQSFQHFDDSGEFLADFLAFASISMNCDTIGSNLIGVLCDLPDNGINFNADVTAKNTCNFIMSLTKAIPKFVLKNFSFFAIFFNQENYSIRNAILDSIGLLMVEKQFENMEQKETTFKSFINILIERIKDVNSFVRSKALSIISQVFSSGQLPINLLLSVWREAAERLKDKASIVRKKALILLCDILKNHPFSFDGGELSEQYFLSKITQIDAAVEKHNTPEIELIQHKNASSKSSSQVEALLLQKNYYLIAIEFAQKIETVLDLVADYFIFCPNKTEVNEAIEFISVCYVLKIEKSQAALGRILPLVWSKDSSGDENNKRSIREHLLNAISVLLFEGFNSEQVAQNLENFYVNFAQCSSYSDCVKEIFQLFCDKKLINKQVLIYLWNDLHNQEKREQAIAVLCLCVQNESGLTISEDKVCRFLTSCPNSSTFMSYFCKFLQQSISSNSTNQKLRDFLVDIVVAKSVDLSWLPPIECSLNSLFNFAFNPIPIIETILKKLAHSIFSNAANINSFQLGKFLFVLGHCSVKISRYLHHLENKLRKTFSNSKSSQSDSNSLEEVVGKISTDENVHELFLLIRDKGIFYDPKSLFSRFSQLPVTICKRVLQEYNSESKSTKNSDKANTDHFSFSMAAICLSKFMSISEVYCKQNLSLFVDLMTKCNNSAVRANLIVAFGDFCTSYNNLVEPHVYHLFNLLTQKSNSSESSPSLQSMQLNSLLILSWLILNGMIKIKGQLYQIALCFLDKNQTISQLSLSFFQDLAQKDSNIIYNNIPDVISNLSIIQDCDENQFIFIMTKIFGLLRKDKQIDSLAGKVIQRMVGCSCKRTSRFLTLCLSLLTQHSWNNQSSSYLEQSVFSKIIESWDSAFKDKMLPDENGKDVFSVKEVLIEWTQKSRKNEMLTDICNQLDALLLGKTHVKANCDENEQNSLSVRKLRSNRK